mgnify:CR=1 FL=1
MKLPSKFLAAAATLSLVTTAACTTDPETGERRVSKTAIGGIGAGIIYGASVGNALKWFSDRRGLAAGLTAAGFGAGSALTVVPIANLIASSGYETAFLWFGIGQGAVVVLVAMLLRAPEPGQAPSPEGPAVQQTRRDYAPAEVLKSPPFWVM